MCTGLNMSKNLKLSKNMSKYIDKYGLIFLKNYWVILASICTLFYFWSYLYAFKYMTLFVKIFQPFLFSGFLIFAILERFFKYFNIKLIIIWWIITILYIIFF